MQDLAPYTVGAYSMEGAPGLPETAAEMELAFGGNLPRLRELKKKWAPQNLFSAGFPF